MDQPSEFAVTRDSIPSTPPLRVGTMLAYALPGLPLGFLGTALLVFLPGFRGKHATLLTTELEQLYPVVPDAANPRGIGSSRPSRFALTEAGRRSLLTRLEPGDNDNEGRHGEQDLSGCRFGIISFSRHVSPKFHQQNKRLP